MKSLIIFIQDFIKNKGLFVFLSLFITKLSLFLTQTFITRLLPKEDYGLIVYYMSIFSFFLPIIGFAAYQGLLRFASIENEEKEKNKLAAYAFWKGLHYQVLITILFVIALVVFSTGREYLLLIVLFLSLRLLGSFFQNISQVNFRLRFDNKMFAVSNVTVNVFGLVISVLLAYFFGLEGYIVALGLAPFISLVFMRKYMFSRDYKDVSVDKKEFWSYSFFTSLAVVVPEFVFIADIIMAKYYFSEEVIANYKTFIILPFNLWFFPQIFLQTDYPKLCANYDNKLFILNYAKNYCKIFFLLGIVVTGFSYVFRDELIPLLFGDKYSGGILFFYLVVAVVFSWFTKTLFSHILGAIGKNDYNVYVGALAVLALVLSGIYLIPVYQFEGLVYSTIISLFVSSFSTFAVFYWVYILKNR